MTEERVGSNLPGKLSAANCAQRKRATELLLLLLWLRNKEATLRMSSRRTRLATVARLSKCFLERSPSAHVRCIMLIKRGHISSHSVTFPNVDRIARAVFILLLHVISLAYRAHSSSTRIYGGHVQIWHNIECRFAFGQPCQQHVDEEFDEIEIARSGCSHDSTLSDCLEQVAEPHHVRFRSKHVPSIHGQQLIINH